jgi:hypothetical protein
MTSTHPRFHEVTAHDGPKIARIAETLRLDGNPPVLLIVGWGSTLDRRVPEDFERTLKLGIAPAIRDTGGIILDGGTDDGISRSIGNVFRTEGPECKLIGFAPTGKISRGVQNDSKKDDRDRVLPAPYHSDIVLVDGDLWGCEMQVTIEVAERLSPDDPVIVVLVGGGGNTEDLVRQTQKREWPLLVLTATGGLADRLYRRRDLGTHRPYSQPGPSPLIETALPGFRKRRRHQTAQTAFADVGDYASVRRAIEWRLHGAGSVLGYGWEQISIYEREATAIVAHRRWTFRVTTAIAVLCNLAALWATIDADVLSVWLAWTSLTIIATILLGSLVRRWPSESKLLVSAELLKREVFRYRCSSEPYRGAHRDGHVQSDQEVLADRLAALSACLPAVSRGLIKVPSQAWPPPALNGAVASDDLLVDELSQAEYLNLRTVVLTDRLVTLADEHSRSSTALFGLVLGFAIATAIVAVGPLANREVTAQGVGPIIAASSAIVIAASLLRLARRHLATLRIAVCALRAAQVRFLARIDGPRLTEALTSLVASEQEALAMIGGAGHLSVQELLDRVPSATAQEQEF